MQCDCTTPKISSISISRSHISQAAFFFRFKLTSITLSCCAIISQTLSVCSCTAFGRFAFLLGAFFFSFFFICFFFVHFTQARLFCFLAHCRSESVFTPCWFPPRHRSHFNSFFSTFSSSSLLFPAWPRCCLWRLLHFFPFVALIALPFHRGDARVT